MKVFSIYELPSFIEKQKGITLGACITDGYVKAVTIEAAQDYFCTRAEEEDEYGAGERDAILVCYDDETDEETSENITLKWRAEKDMYDGGRHDFYSSRGCV